MCRNSVMMTGASDHCCPVMWWRMKAVMRSGHTAGWSQQGPAAERLHWLPCIYVFENRHRYICTVNSVYTVIESKTYTTEKIHTRMLNIYLKIITHNSETQLKKTHPKYINPKYLVHFLFNLIILFYLSWCVSPLTNSIYCWLWQRQCLSCPLYLSPVSETVSDSHQVIH